MFELFFVILFKDGDVVKEQFSDEFNTHIECLDTGWIRAGNFSDQIREKHPAMTGFDVECKSKSVRT